MEWIKLEIDPVPWQRATPMVGGRSVAVIPKKTRDFERDIAILFAAKWKRPRLEGPVEMMCCYAIRRPGKGKPGSRQAFPITGFDIDNLEKALMDGISKSKVVWKDDAQVVQVNKRKRWSDSKTGWIKVGIGPLRSGLIPDEFLG